MLVEARDLLGPRHRNRSGRTSADAGCDPL
jgi:hypothetical protein